MGELNDPSPTRPTVTWISLVQLRLRRVGSVQNHAFSFSELRPSGLGRTVSCFVLIGVTVETLQGKKDKGLFSRISSDGSYKVISLKLPYKLFVLSQIRGLIVVLRDRIQRELKHSIDLSSYIVKLG